MEEAICELKPCPRCKSSDVEWTNSRYCNILEQYIYCNECALITFTVETISDVIDLPDLDYQTTCLKYNAWCDTNPTRYRLEDW